MLNYKLGTLLCMVGLFFVASPLATFSWLGWMPVTTALIVAGAVMLLAGFLVVRLDKNMRRFGWSRLVRRSPRLNRFWLAQVIMAPGVAVLPITLQMASSPEFRDNDFSLMLFVELALIAVGLLLAATDRSPVPDSPSF